MKVIVTTALQHAPTCMSRGKMFTKLMTESAAPAFTRVLQHHVAAWQNAYINDHIERRTKRDAADSL